MTKKVWVYFVSISLFLTSFLYSANTSYELNVIKNRSKSYSVRKHIDYALYFNEKGMNDNFINEIKVLKEIDSKHALFYEKILESSVGPAGVFLDIAHKENYSKEIMDKIESAALDYRESRIDSAERKLGEVMKIDPDNNAAKMFIREIDEEDFENGTDELFKSDAQQLYEEGMSYYRKGMYLQSGKLFKAAFNEDPMNVSIRRFIKLSKISASQGGGDNAKTLMKQASDFENSDDVAKARDALENAAVFGDETAKTKLAEYNEKSEELQKEAAKLLKEGKVKEAYMKNMEALDYNPNSKAAQAQKDELRKSIPDDQAADLIADVAKKTLSDGDVDKARVLYEKAAAMGDPNAQKAIEDLNDQSATLSQQAEDLMKQGKTKEAYLKTVQALELNSGNEKAKQLLASLKSSIPDGVAIDLIYNQGVDFYLQKDYYRAIEAWDNVLKIDPKDSQTLANIKKANAKLAIQIANDKKNAAKAYDDGKVLMSQGLMEKALNKFEYVLRLIPEDTAAGKKLDQVKKEMDVTYDKDAVIKR